MRILFVTSYVPALIGGGSALRSYNFIIRLLESHEVSLLALSAESDMEIDAREDWESKGVQVTTVPLTWSEDPTLREKLRRLTTLQPYRAQAFVNPQMRNAFRSMLADHRPDVVHLDLLRMAWCIQAAHGQVPMVLDMHNVETQRARSEMGQKQLSLKQRILAEWEYFRLQRFESETCGRASWVIAVTPEDKDTLCRQAGHDRVTYVPNGVDTDYFQPVPTSDDPTLIFVGTMSYNPNIDAVLYFCREILLLVADRVPSVRFLIVGRDPSPEIRALDVDPRIEVTGTVPDVRPYFARSAVCVIPTRIGGGVKNKVLEAMAMGMPVVTNSFSTIGIPLEPSKHACVCDTPEAFANATIRLLENPKERRELGQAAAKFISTNYSWRDSVALLEKAYQHAIEYHSKEIAR